MEELTQEEISVLLSALAGTAHRYEEFVTQFLQNDSGSAGEWNRKIELLKKMRATIETKRAQGKAITL